MRDIALRNRTLENPSQCEGFETKEKERETFCVRFGKWTRFLRWRARLLGCEKKQNVTYMLHLEKNNTLRGVLSMPLYSMKEGKDDERN